MSADNVDTNDLILNKLKPCVGFIGYAALPARPVIITFLQKRGYTLSMHIVTDYRFLNENDIPFFSAFCFANISKIFSIYL